MTTLARPMPYVAPPVRVVTPVELDSSPDVHVVPFGPLIGLDSHAYMWRLTYPDWDGTAYVNWIIDSPRAHMGRERILAPVNIRD